MKKSSTFLLLFTFFLAACTSLENLNLSQFSDEDLARVSNAAIVCNPPYIRFEIGCCLDTNANSICDQDEGISSDLPLPTPSQQPPAPTVDEPFPEPLPPVEQTPPPQPPTSLTVGVTDATRTIQVSQLTLQQQGVAFTDPNFGTSIRRASATSNTAGSFETHTYSQLQAFSSDNAYILLNGEPGYMIRRTSDFAILPGLSDTDINTFLPLEEINVPRWHPTQSHIIVHFDTNADEDLTLQFTNVDTKTTTDIATLPGLVRIQGAQSFDELSHDGRWITGLAVSTNEDPTIFAYDMINRQFGARMTLPQLYSTACPRDQEYGEVEPDWIGASPLGTYLVVQWKRDGDQRCSGLETFNVRTGEFIGRVTDGHQHGDLGVDSQGREFFMTYEVGHPSGEAAIGVRYLPGLATVAPVTYPLILPDWIGDHISCQNQQPAGYCLITTSPGLNGQHDPLERELFLLSVDGRVRRLAHHRSSQDSYWAQPRASISRDGRYVIFASDWGRNPGQDSVDPYIIDLRPTEQTPTGAVIAPPEPSTPSPPPTQTPTLPLTTLTGTIAFNIAEQQWYSEPVITQNTVRFVLHNYLGNEGCNEAYPGKYLYHFYTAPLGSTSYTRVQATQETLTGCDKFSDFIIPFSTQGTYNVAGCVALDGDMNRNICEILEAATA